MKLYFPSNSAGAMLVEESPVKDAKFDKSKGLWTVTIEDSEITYQVPENTCQVH